MRKVLNQVSGLFIGLFVVFSLEAATLTMYVFRGVHSQIKEAGPSFQSIAKKIQFGHVAFSLDSGKTIYGFGPEIPKGISAEELASQLWSRQSFPGKLVDDTELFELILADEEFLGEGIDPLPFLDVPIRIYAMDFEIDEAAVDLFLSDIEISKRGALDIFYSFPNMKGNGPFFEDNNYNCASYSKRLHISSSVPLHTGRLSRIVQKMNLLLSTGEVRIIEDLPEEE